MHFKKLEIVGFKSFMNKTKLKFEPGVTAVVGPNGCGKSNIVDAIKWVLGEQSTKSMRSSSMQDVIFNGTDKFDPVNVAEVSLTLSNEDRALPVDYDEVTVSRRLYRSGESEYILNKMPVRLADVRNLLMGTGIGTSSYSIVEQGRMDMILSSKPEERRHVFEEASGITRYKAKKREAMLKLDRTKENLVRISDITREVERQIKSIERKARKAERYKVQFDELKGLEVKLSYKKYKELSTDDSSLIDKTRGLKGRSEELSREVGQLSEMLIKSKENYNSLVENLNIAQNEVMRLSSDIDKSSHTVDVNRERVGELSKQVERLDWEIEEATERKDKMKNRLDSLEARFQEVSKNRQDKDEALKGAEENVRLVTAETERYKHELKLNRDRTVDIVDEQTKMKNSSIRVSADIQNGLSREKRLKLERNNVHIEKEKVIEKLKDIEQEVEIAKREFDSKKEEFSIFNQEYLSNQQKLTSITAERLEREKRLNELKPRREFLQKLIAEREGMKDSVKEIIKRAEVGDARFAGVHGILSELINVRENYEESFESVLADASHAIVVDTREVATRVIEFLSENSMESVNLIILEDVKRFLASGTGPVITKGILDDITHVVSAQEPYSSALRALLSDVFVTISPEAARMFIENDQNFRGCIVGEKGEVFRKGIIRSKNFSSKETIPLFGRKEKVEEMLAEEERITGKINQISEKIAGLEEWLKESAVKKDRLEKDLREREMRFADISSRKASIREKLDSVNEEILLLETEIEEEREVLTQLRSEKERLDEAITRVEEENRKLQELVSAAQFAIQENARRREETLFCMADLKAELSGLTKEEENLADNLQRERSFFEKIDGEVEEKRVRINESGERITFLEAESKALGERIVENNARLEVLSREISERKESKEALSSEINHSEGEIRAKEQELESARDKARDMDIMKKELEYKRASIAEKMLDTYKVDISSLEMELEEETNWDEIENQIDEFKQQLDKMGDVSLGAVEEHRQLEERFTFLTKQRDDLESAREQLMQAIQKINRTTRKKFMESFEAIRTEFNDYFRMLFNGGKGDLVLEDESNVLECGIDIIVRPPGKKLHNIMQLSGGEKAMTAIALIFAIFKVNPSPFCILDEIDAPLDESNVVRFCRVLQEFLKLSQFVIVTHNRMTIQLADVLYGITMQEKGVSKIVSVKFAEEKEVESDVEVPVAA